MPKWANCSCQTQQGLDARLGPQLQNLSQLSGADVLHQLTGKIRYRSEDAKIDYIALDLGEPNLDLIQPRRVRRCEVEANTRIQIEELGHSLRLVCRQVIEDDVDVFRIPCSFDDICQKNKELFAGVTASRFAVYLSGFTCSAA
jgi:hypothetical protein